MNAPAPLSVKRLLEQIKARVEAPFSSVCVVGEVSNFRASGKHWYFTLKEEGAALQCAVWASQQRFLKHQPANGERVVVQGGLNLYVAGGSLTLAITHCERAGQGDLQARLRELEAQLRTEGLFDRPKRPIPPCPQRIGIVAAIGGAALRDVLEVTARRAPGIDILIHAAAAQGERCVPENLMALQELQDPYWHCDVILLVRGGGSLEDLWGYNDPELVRAVAACRVPVITGVGHEIDITLVDLAADRRAATPSQAAEFATPDRARLASELCRRVDALTAYMARRLRIFETELNLRVEHGLLRSDPVELTRVRMEGLTHRLHLAHPLRRLDQLHHRLGLLRQRLRHASIQMEVDRPRLVHAMRRLLPAAAKRTLSACHRLELLTARLAAMDPASPLERGFVLVADASGKMVTSAMALPTGAPIDLRWRDGTRQAVLGRDR